MPLSFAASGGRFAGRGQRFARTQRPFGRRVDTCRSGILDTATEPAFDHIPALTLAHPNPVGRGSCLKLISRSLDEGPIA